MSLSESLIDVGRPVAYYPRLARFFGSVNVAILFGQLFYWHQRSDSDIGVYKTSEDLEEETGLSYREQATARKQLRSAGFLVETHRRLEHRVYYRLDMGVVDAAFDEWTKAKSANDENAVREQRQAQSADDAKRGPGVDESSPDELRQAQSVKSTETTKETTAETTAYISSQPAAPLAGEGKGGAADAGDSALQDACRATWSAYCEAYLRSYQVKPVRNAKVNDNVKALVKRLGYEEAPLVAAWYVECVREAYVLKDSHGVGALLAKAESYRTQWARGQAITGTAAQAADKTSANLDAIEEAKRLMRQRGMAKGEVIDV